VNYINKDGILALDFGTKNVGLAISHGFMAEALKSLNYLNDKSTFIKELQKIVEEQKVGKIVIGLPLKDGEDSSQSNWTRQQAMEISQHIDLDIEFVDESYSTLQAIDELSGSGDIDSQSAKIILEQYLSQVKK